MRFQIPSPGVAPADILNGRRVVIVEDEGVTQMQLHMILTKAGLRVLDAATDVQTGIHMVLDELPDIVLMDINMLDKIDGLEAASALLKTVRVCIVIVTAYSDDEHQRRAEEIGASGYVIKPVAGKTLLPYLKEVYYQWQQTPVTNRQKPVKEFA